MKKIPYANHYIDNDDIEAILNVLKNGPITQGPKIDEFEKKLCQYTGAKYCIVVANGTAALHLSVKALELKPGVEGITSPITFVASAKSML